MAMTHGKANTLSPGSIKRMLTGASPKNPTYVLGSVVSDFNSQGPTELTVSDRPGLSYLQQTLKLIESNHEL